MITEAMIVVHMNVMTVVPISLPARFTFFMLAIDEEMEKKTIGTTTQNIMLMNSVPSGSSAPAPSHTKPTMMPSTMPRIIEKKNQLLFRKFFMAASLTDDFHCTLSYPIGTAKRIAGFA